MPRPREPPDPIVERLREYRRLRDEIDYDPLADINESWGFADDPAQEIAAMPIVKEESAPRDPIPEGMHQAVCFAVVDLGKQPPSPNAKYPKTERKIMFMFEFPEERRKFSRDGVDHDAPRVISKDFAASLYEKAGLRKFLVAWRGRQFTPVELDGFDLKNVLGVNLMLTIVHNTVGNKVYDNIQSCGPLPKGLPKRMAENELILYDITDPVVPPTLPEWIRKKIAHSEEHANAVYDGSRGGGAHESQPPDDDDIPF